MIIRSLQTTNYRQHRGAKTWRFDGNLVGVIGPNGSGKSHLIDAIEFLFTGKVGGQNKSDMISWGETEGSVTGTFVHEGSEGVIVRELHGSRATFKFRDADVKGITSVNSAIAEMTGMDAEICRQAVFVHQKEIDAILFTEPAVRQLAWQRLCGLSMANAVHADLGVVINRLPPIVDWSTQIDECNSRIAELNRQIQMTTGALAQTQTALGPGSYEQVQRHLEQLTALAGLMTQTVDGNRLLATSNQELAQAKTALEGLQRQFAAAGGKSPRERLDAVRQEFAAGQRIQQLVTEYGTAGGWEKAYRQQLAALMPPALDQSGIDNLNREAAQRKATEAAERSQLSLYRQLLSALCGLNADARCPLCTQALTAGLDLKALTEKSIADIENRRRQAENEARQFERQVVEARNRLTEYEANTGRLKTQIAGAQATVAGLEQQLTNLRTGRLAAVTPALLLELEQEKGRLQQAADAFDLLQLSIGRSETQVTLLTANVQKIAAQVEQGLTAIQRQMAELGVDDPGKIDTLITAGQGERQRLLEGQRLIGELTGQLRQMQTQFKNLEQTLADLSRKKTGQAAQHEASQVLTRVRDWFHYTNGPQTVINSLHGRITAGVNDFLQRFGATFYVMPDLGSMSFRYCYHDGRPMPDGFPTVDQLSGGEAVVLAVSFRLATYCLFAGRVGLLTLDEPTVYLDDRHISQFCTLLNRVKEIATGMHLQIFISTHEQSVIPFLDSVVNLNSAVATPVGA